MSVDGSPQPVSGEAIRRSAAAKRARKPPTAARSQAVVSLSPPGQADGGHAISLTRRNRFPPNPPGVRRCWQGGVAWAGLPRAGPTPPERGCMPSAWCAPSALPGLSRRLSRVLPRGVLSRAVTCKNTRDPPDVSRARHPGRDRPPPDPARRYPRGRPRRSWGTAGASVSSSCPGAPHRRRRVQRGPRRVPGSTSASPSARLGGLRCFPRETRRGACRRRGLRRAPPSAGLPRRPPRVTASSAVAPGSDRSPGPRHVVGISAARPARRSVVRPAGATPSRVSAGTPRVRRTAGHDGSRLHLRHRAADIDEEPARDAGPIPWRDPRPCQDPCRRGPRRSLISRTAASACTGMPR